MDGTSQTSRQTDPLKSLVLGWIYEAQANIDDWSFSEIHLDEMALDKSRWTVDEENEFAWEIARELIASAGPEFFEKSVVELVSRCGLYDGFEDAVIGMDDVARASSAPLNIYLVGRNLWRSPGDSELYSRPVKQEGRGNIAIYDEWFAEKDSGEEGIWFLQRVVSAYRRR